MSTINFTTTSIMLRVQSITGLTPLTIRYLLFLIGCIGIRSIFVYAAKSIPPPYLKWSVIPALALVIGWLAIYLFNLRDTGGEVFGAQIWWDHMRPIHAGLYLAFAVMAYKGDQKAWYPLALDVVLGLLAFIQHHFFLQ